ncbi:recombinase family protein [Allofournierella massiliensis]|uniref:recombinase family protein n=1 Tax=Allofournierella massiliensis TaxID=1650663 RepID=UPI0039A1206E
MERDAMMTPIALYLRLSSADGEGAESGSIANQRTYLHRWAEENGFRVMAEFQDDGYTGTDFERPGFQRLMAQLKSGRIRCFATTDLSRLGRNCGQALTLVEETFQRLGVRYIAVNDGYDTEKMSRDSLDPSVFKFLLNELYAKDCSAKVLRAKRTLQKEGKFLGGQASYGYRIDPADKYRLLPDEETAPVVRRIYHSFLAGQTLGQIARALEQQGIPSPAACRAGREGGAWSTATLRRILTLPTYRGALTQHVTEMTSYKVHTRRPVPPGQWTVCENTHPPLVSEEEFRQAQALLGRRRYASRTGEHALSGLVVCADCGGRMYPHRVGGYCYFICGTYARNSGRCSAHRIREDRLEQLVLERLRPLMQCAAASEQLARCLCVDRSSDQIDQERLQQKLDRLAAQRRQAYVDRLEGLIDAGEYAVVSARLRKKEEGLRCLLQRQTKQKTGSDLEEMRKRAEDLLELKRPNRAVLGRLIRKITVAEDGGVEIYCSFARPLPGDGCDNGVEKEINTNGAIF